MNCAISSSSSGTANAELIASTTRLEQNHETRYTYQTRVRSPKRGEGSGCWPTGFGRAQKQPDADEREESMLKRSQKPQMLPRNASLFLGRLRARRSR